MKQIRHTITCPLDEYRALELTFDLGMTQVALDEARLNGSPAPALVDIPNWDAAAADMEKPDFPLDNAAFRHLPFVLVSYLTSDEAIRDALDDYMVKRHPNSNRT